jgi:putative membrane protein
MKVQLKAGLAGCAAALLCMSAMAQSTSSSSSHAKMPTRTASAGGTGTIDTESFVKQASQDGMTEVEAGKLAESKAQSTEVKDFAKRMVADHTKADNELKSIASRKGIKVASALDSEHKSMVDNLRSKTGSEFDTAYTQDMASDHQKAVDLFQQAGSSASIDSDVKSFAQKTLPTLEKHKQMADALESGSSASGTGTSSRSSSRTGSSSTTGQYGSRTDSSSETNNTHGGSSGSPR